MTATVTSAGRGSSTSLAAPIACGCCMLAGAAYVAAENPSDGGTFIPCPFRTLTGLWCPGCGMTRATHHLLRGNVMQALHYNLFVIVILLALTAAWFAWLLNSAGRTIRTSRWVPVPLQVAAGVALLSFAFVRNLPGVPGLRG
ncbi:DUF2752 domain-containing protein [Ilumatobacter sp.]|uniref:DUF2752 domain-containing protein n=1 Tax=Ilumatobacter sp. TaxID=1967498 RepID=UPI003AF87CC4